MAKPRRQPETTTTDASGADELTSRSDVRRAERQREDALVKLAKDLSEMRPRWLDNLDLPEEVFDAVVEAQPMTGTPALVRQLRLIRKGLRDADWSLIRARVDALNKHGTLPPKLAPQDKQSGHSISSAAARAPEWVARMLGEGSKAIEALLEIVPNADRTHLRNLVRQVHKANSDRKEKARAKLTRAVEGLLRSA